MDREQWWTDQPLRNYTITVGLQDEWHRVAVFLPASLKEQVTANLSRVAAAIDYRCAAHQYRSLAAGHSDLALYDKVMP